MNPSGRNAFLTEPDEKLLAECTVETYRSSGPGGQHRNKTDSAVRLTHRPTGVVATATERRSQHENRHRAIGRLRQAIAVEVRQPVAPGAAPSGLLRQVLGDPAWPRVSQRSDAYLVAAAEILDHVAAHEGKISEAAERLGVATAALVKFLWLDRDLWQMANRIRQRFGHKALR